MFITVEPVLGNHSSCQSEVVGNEGWLPKIGSFIVYKASSGDGLVAVGERVLVQDTSRPRQISIYIYIYIYISTL